MMVKESEFTQPSEFCRNPEYWHSNDVDSSEYEVSELVAAFVKALQPELVIETGTAFGQTAEYIGKTLAANGHGRLVTLEPDEDRCEIARRRCDGLPVEVVNCKSSDFDLETMDYEFDNKIDFLWLDSLLELRFSEFLKFLPFLSDKAVVGFHDTAPHHNNYLGELGKYANFISLHTPRGVTFATVKESK